MPIFHVSESSSDMNAPEQVLARLRDRILAAAADRTPLRILGGDSKGFLGRTPQGESLATGELSGVISYEPTELVVRALSGTPLAELEAALAERNQMLAFEPPSFAPGATVGGMVAAGLSGPRRAQAGAVRDHVLGASLLDAQGRLLHFGGQVMKNVAGYDVSRLLCGSMGILGLITEVSLKVLPRPAAEQSLVIDCAQPQAFDLLVRWGGEPLPVSASVWYADRLLVRLSGARAAVEAASRRFAAEAGAQPVAPSEAAASWHAVREQRLPFFADATRPLWRLSLPQTAPVLSLPGEQLIEWGGALRWLSSDAPAEQVREKAKSLGGAATLFRHADRSGEVFPPLSSGLLAVHRRLKAAFDPVGIFNPGRLYAEL
jgi:glycolate oxidase FAD binding subunit